MYSQVKIVIAWWVFRGSKKYAWQIHTKSKKSKSGWRYRCDCNRHFSKAEEAIADAKDVMAVPGGFFRKEREFTLEYQFKAPKPKRKKRTKSNGESR